MSAERHARYAIAALTNLLKLVVGRGRVQQVDDSGSVQVLQLTLNAKETPNVRRVAEFGFQSWPMPNCDAIALFVGGDRSNGVVLGTNDQTYRLKLGNPGEVALSDAFGRYIWFKKEGGIQVEAAGQDVTVNNAANVTVHATTKIILDAPLTEVTGNLKVDGDINCSGNVSDSVRSMAADRGKYDVHIHSVSGSTTGPPTPTE